MHLQLLFVFYFLCVTLTVSLAVESPVWTLVWRDDFNGPKGTPPSSANWFHDIGHDGSYDFYTNSTANACLSGKSSLVITALRDAAGNWTSAQIGSVQL